MATCPFVSCYPGWAVIDILLSGCIVCSGIVVLLSKQREFENEAEENKLKSWLWP